MGGFGSGQRWSKKVVVESQYSIDTATLKRWKLLVPGTINYAGSFRWSRGGDPKAAIGFVLTVGAARGTLAVAYRFPDQDGNLAYPIRLVTTRCHLGGVRWWFLCPLSRDGVACGRRVRALYLHGKYFGCRTCHQLTYASCQESDARVNALVRAGVHRMGDPKHMSLQQLGLALKAFTLHQKRIDRMLQN